MTAATNAAWRASRIRRDEIDKYLRNGIDFIPDNDAEALLAPAKPPDASRVRDIIARSLAIQTLVPADVAALMRVRDPALFEEMKSAATEVKRRVYDNRIVTFAPLYLSNLCVNNCLYCGLRCSNATVERGTLGMDAIRREVEVLAGRIGHKRLIVVYGEHADSGIDYMVESIRTIYGVKVPVGRGVGNIRRVNVNAPPLPVEELRQLHEAGLGTYQVFQETYYRSTYAAVHPAGSIKGDYRWRLYSMHRAMEAGIDDVGIGALFGLYDWRYEVLGLLYHTLELERAFGIGPHTISFPRLEPAANTPLASDSRHKVGDDDFERAVVVLRLAVPYTGMIVTARESPTMRRRLIPLGCTQTDASSRVGIGAYGDASDAQNELRQQFMLGDTRSLDEMVRELAGMGYITSFCTAGYRCGRTGACIMELLRSGREGKFCKLNAVLTFREWLDDFASPATKAAGERVLRLEMEEIKRTNPRGFPAFLEFYKRICAGERDLFL